jgi:ribose/xylose/arabinose/galactoside ABC-type transport system permease subunit
MPSVGDVKAKIVGFVLTLVMLIIVLNLTPVFIDSAQITMNWSEPGHGVTGDLNFTGATAAKTLMGLLPLIIVIVIFVAIAITLFEDLI